ncbi:MULTISPECIES: TetR/AcrR family transcriptional regulator [Chryseobacterium]|uniref:Transcriptional regulator, TetR family n=1 Tax=Chryseobacterium scophthalmum TaxID=59733 RepID=A0A1N6EVU0_9FLAO|nr:MULTISPECIES: TetR/AcrR family transcriptional regulator [Chryseobacterium]MBM7419903.1 AcrR family transcriptional regulator [Chryseobacterium sp. JUb44]MDH6209841.1 AcrR family transcriptional regulator [Chryseobacterium sp. BIGb0186]WSO08580.1 TetR/AcrR family transcriptional regulator [Chryseobacterium scophthalmum]SIN87212.1 transcriptional regulator, TetR family [Chryseobacterium scophthalmum]VXB34597.1 Transcriptional regulator, TetR family [Chryseobacterium sp. 8AT]
MPRKVVQGPIRDKEKTKQKLLNAVGKILKTKGYSGLMVSKIAAVAGFDKKLIYEYFGSTDKLIDEYIRSQDYWSKFELGEDVDLSDGGREMSKLAILNQFENLKKNKELQKILVWEMSESRPILKKLLDQREEVGEELFKNITDPHFGDKAEEYRAITAILVAGIYHLNLYTGHNGVTFCGIEMKTEEGRKKIEKALVDIIDFAYNK